MKQKLAVKRSVDVLMTLSLLSLMGYQFWGDTAMSGWEPGCLSCSSRTIF